MNMFNQINNNNNKKLIINQEIKIITKKIKPKIK